MTIDKLDISITFQHEDLQKTRADVVYLNRRLIYDIKMKGSTYEKLH